MTVEIFNRLGQLDLSLITEQACADANLTPEQTQALSVLVDAVKTRESADILKIEARKRVHVAANAEMVALAANDAANPPPDFQSIRKASIAAYNGVELEEIKPTSHPKHAKAGPKIAFEKAQAETIDARAELQAATVHARRCELSNGAALASWLAVNRPPTQDQVHRAMIAAEQAAKLERISKDLPLTPTAKPTHGNSPIDIAAAARGRAGTKLPLRSNVTRR
jgi:hypothetical protein